MSEWIRMTFEASDQPSWDVLLGRLLAAAVLGGAAAGIYTWTHRRDESFTVSFLATLVFLSILMATVTQVIGDNAARAFGLVGALAIVRFRTVVQDTRDTAFVMLAVVLGMAVGAAHTGLAIAALGLAAVTAFVLQPRRPNGNGLAPEWNLTVRIGLGRDPEVLEPIYRKHLIAYHATGTGTGRQGAALDLAYRVRLAPDTTPAALVAELNRLEGVQNVELQRL
jgi:hypothetical protein